MVVALSGGVDSVALLDLNGPYPAPVAAAMDTLRRHPDGVVTMRDLALPSFFGG